MELIELIIDEKDPQHGIEAVSVVEYPAIEENFIALNKQQVQLKEIDQEKRILMGPALTPNKKIYRKDDKTNREWEIFFSENTVRKASELFLMRSNQNNATLEHAKDIDGMSVVESWIIDDPKSDKSRLYGFDLPKGTWMISMKVNNDDIWAKVKAGEVKGFSIEGYFADKYEMSIQQSEKQQIIEELKKLLQLESYSDYPEQAKENAKIALRWAEENGWGDCGTSVGKIRAN